MPADQSKAMSPENLGTGVYNPKDFSAFDPNEGMVCIMYGNDPDVSIVVWNLEPGQENSTHVHPTSTHVQMVLQGAGEYLKDGKPVPCKAGDAIIVPRGVVHGVRNTGKDRLSYMAVTSVSPEGYDRQPVGEQKVSLGH